MVKVSVIMPVYNCEDFLQISVGSILNQTLSDLELVCVDDGSSDNSLNILKEYEKQDSRVKVFSLNHLGAGDARNFALNHICGEYLYFMDADDCLELNAFEDFYRISKSKNLDFLMFKAKQYDVIKKTTSERYYYNMVPISNFKDKVFNFNDLNDLIFNINVTPWCKFYNTRFVLDSGAKFRSASKFNDNQFFWDIIFQAERIYFLDEFYYTQNVHPNSLIESAGKNHCDKVDVVNGIWDLFKKHGQFDKFKLRLYNNKVASYVRRYDEIKDEFKELFFKKIKNDFKNLKNDYRDYLDFVRIFAFDSVMISNNHQDFDILKEFYYILINDSSDINQKMNQSIGWFDKLSKSHKRFAFNYIRLYFINYDLTSENREFLNNFQYDISIIIPVFNVENYLDDAFNSILNQTFGFDNLEIIFIDDASTDGSSQIINEYSDKHENVISIFLDKNSGYAGLPRNIGMYYATAPYLMFLDPDDVFMDDACETLYNQIAFDNLDVVCGVHSDGDSGPDWILLNVLTDCQEPMDIRYKKYVGMVKDSNFELKIDSVDEYPSIIAAANIFDKIFKKSFIEDNTVKFPEAIPAEDSVFLVDAFLNAHGIKFINKIIVRHDYGRGGSVQHQFSKTKIIKRIKSYYMMFYSFIDKNKTDIFKHYLLVTKLEHILVDHIMKCNLPTGDILEILVYVKPLFKLYCNHGGLIPKNLHIFKDIACGDFEKALMFIQGENTPKLVDVKCINSTDYSIEHCVDLSDDWVGQFENTNPDLFIFDEINKNQDILDYCSEYNVQSACIGGHKNLKTILDSINFKYIPDLKHLVLIYRLDDLKKLNGITNHFYSIKYPFKHLKMITTEENLFLNNTILESDLANIDFGDNYYYCFADLDFKFNENAFNKDYKKFTDFNTFMRDMKQHELLFKENVLLKEINETKINILDMDASLDLLLDNRKSISRIGDGEVKIILGRNPGFQKFDQKLSDRLREILYNNDQDFCYIGVPNELNGFNNRIPATKEYWINYLYSYRKKWLDLLNLEKIYLNANITRPYLRFSDKSKCKSYFESFKRLWHNKNVILCEGEFSRVGVNNDLLSNCKSIKRVLCPHKDAFSKYDEIFNRLKRYGKDNLFLIALGPTATVLSYDLAEEGYYALDIGHLDIEYEWFLRKATKKISIENKWVNEVPENTITENFYDEDYFNQIDCIIK